MPDRSVTGALAVVTPGALARRSPRRGNEWQRYVPLWLHGRPESTKGVYLPVIREFEEFVSPRLISQVTLEDLQDFCDRHAGQKAATVGRKAATCKSLLTWCHKCGLIPFDVGRALRVPKVHREIARKILPPADIQRMIRMEPVPRNRILLRVLYLCGLRASEAAGLRWCDLDARDDGGQLTVLGKGNKVRAVRLARDAWRELLALRPKGSAPHERVFITESGRPMHRTTLSNLVRFAARRAGIDAKVSAHWMRHGHASHAIEKGAPITLIAATLGHSSIQTTMHYIHARPEQSSGRYLTG